MLFFSSFNLKQAMHVLVAIICVQKILLVLELGRKKA